MSTKIKSVQHSRICRICLQVDVSNGVLIGTEDTWLELYDFCLGITINPEDVSRKLCGDCAQKLNDFADFKKLAHRSHKLWQCSVKFPIKTSIKVEKNEESYDIFDSDDHDDNGNTETGSLDVKLKGLSKVTNENKYDEIDKEDAKIENIKPELQNENVESFMTEELNKKNVTSNICENCNKSFRNKLLLKKHIKKNTCKSKAIDDSCFYCGLCDTTSPNEQQLKQHVTEHCLNNDLCCKLCDYNGRDFADMTMHRYSHIPKGYSSSLICHLVSCNKKFQAQLALQYHYRVVHLKMKKGGWCTVCNKQFTCYKSWRNHERLHSSDNYICDICGQKFLFRNAIITHMEIHSDYKRYICDVCGNGFKRASYLRLHLKTKHNCKKVKCEHCNKVFKNQFGLDYHLRRIALKDRYQCEVCSKTFHVPIDLRYHMIWHKEERPFVCNICGASYKANSQLKVHKRKHSGDMPFKCNSCSRCFPSSNQLKVHVSVHTGVRRHKCLRCPKSFHWKKLLLEHCAKHHNGQNELHKEVDGFDDTKKV